ncbi:HAMP domain-containing sensor histidine kinase [Paenibacillus sp. F4]|uniref:GAF domain-containing sensor histidine kinase n=1 Tax=Paenibacillus sp. F4 TaxID=357385 RepID=UPI000C9F3FD8|nr:HAMP domain-containing sensor histidine kinase [Paenibacillus sp. F4]PNQ82366.1 sensor histidine kinase [Paenibacillus sp. F4]
MITSPTGFYNSIQEATAHVIDVLSDILHVNTIFIAANDGITNVIVDSFNREEVLVRNGEELPFELSYCSLVLNHSADYLIISETSTHPQTRDLDVTKTIGNHSFTGIPIRMKNGQAYGTICILDAPSVHLTESELKALQAMAVFLGYVVELEKGKIDAEISSMSKLDLISSLSNKIRFSLTEIWGATDLMLTTELTEEQQQYMSIMESSSRSLMTLLSNILDYSHMESRQIDDIEDPFDLRTMMENVLSLYTEVAAQRNLELKLDWNLTSSPIFIGDEAKIRRMLINLVDNAVKFTSTGAVILSATTQSVTDAPEVELELKVKDTGIGISPNKLKLWLEHDRGNSPSYGNPGLGWQITKHLLKRMNGKMTGISEPGSGTEITLQFTLKTYQESA